MIAALCWHYHYRPDEVRDMPLSDIHLLWGMIPKAV